MSVILHRGLGPDPLEYCQKPRWGGGREAYRKEITFQAITHSEMSEFLILELLGQLKFEK